MVILAFVRQPLNADDSPVYPGCCRISCRVSCCLATAVTGCFTPTHRPSSGSSLHTLTLPAAWRQVSSISIHLAHSRVHAARDLHDLSSSKASVSARLSDQSRSRSEWVVSEICVLCSGRFVLLTRRECHQRVDWLAFETRHERVICVLLEHLRPARKRNWS